jgi:hypothetical protein
MAIIKAPNWRGKETSPSVASLERTNQGYTNRLASAGFDATPPKPKKTFLGTVGDWFSRADYALGNIAQREGELYKKETEDHGKLGGSLSWFGKWLAPTHFKQNITDIYQGFTGQKKGDLRHAATDFGFSDKPFSQRNDILGKTLGKIPLLKNTSAAGAVAYGASMANPLDPLNYVGLGQAADAAKVAGKAAPWGIKVGGKVVKELPGVQKGLLAAGRFVREDIPGVSSVIQSLGPAISNWFRKKGTDPRVWDDYVGMAQGYKAATKSIPDRVLEGYVEKLGRFTRNERIAFFDALENPKLVSSLSPELQTLVKQEKAFLKRAGLEAMDKDILGTMIEDYAAHVRGKDWARGERQVAKTYGRTTSPLKPRDTFAKPRTIEGPVRDINAKLGMEYFEPDYLVAGATRESSRQMALETAKFVNGVLQRFGQKVKKGAKAAQGYGLFTITRGGKEITYELPAQIAGQLSQWTKRELKDEAVSMLGNAWNKATNLWKGYATAANPGFHIRNAISNKYNRWLGDSASLVGDALALRAKMGSKATVMVNGVRMTLDEILKLSKEKGVIGGGFFSADMPNAIRDTINERGLRSWVSPNTINPLSQKFAPLRVGRKVGSFVEDTDRLAMFINQLRKGADPDAAAKTVNKFLFDYGDLTPAMRSLRNTAVPFLAWQKGNIPLQITQLLENPAKLNRTLKTIRAASQGNQPSDKGAYLPEYMRNLNSIPLGLKDSSGNPLYLNPNLPFQDLNKLDPMAFLTQGLNPLIKVPLELYQNRSWFFNSPIEKIPGEQTKFLGIPMRKKTAYVGQSVPFFSSLDKLITKTKAGDPGTGKGLSPAQLQALSWLGGVKLMPYDADKERKNQAYSERDRLQALIRAFQDQGKLPKPSSQSASSAFRMTPEMRKLMARWGR